MVDLSFSMTAKLRSDARSQVRSPEGEISANLTPEAAVKAEVSIVERPIRMPKKSSAAFILSSAFRSSWMSPAVCQSLSRVPSGCGDP